MTTLYRPVPITSAEHAATFPEGTFAVRWDVPWIGSLVSAAGDGDWQSKNGIYTHAEMVGDTALVPIEAEEETMWEDSAYFRTQTRLVTPWEPA